MGHVSVCIQEGLAFVGLFPLVVNHLQHLSSMRDTGKDEGYDEEKRICIKRETAILPFKIRDSSGDRMYVG